MCVDSSSVSVMFSVYEIKWLYWVFGGQTDIMIKVIWLAVISALLVPPGRRSFASSHGSPQFKLF